MIERASKILFLLILVELCLGGGGRFTAIGPVSLRMILFSMALVMSIPLLINKKSVPAEIWKLIIGFACMILVGTIVGWANQNPKNLIYEDVKPICYFFILPFFYLTIDEAVIAKIIKAIKASSVLIAVIFISLLVLINSDIIPFLDFYRATLKSEELFYRGELTFFYKGFLFFGIGAIFYYFTDHSKWKRYFLLVLVIAIILSVTRGLLISLALTFSIYFLLTKSYWKASAGLALVVILVVWGSTIILSGSRLFDARLHNKSYSEADPYLLGDKNYSDNGRMTQAKEVWQEFSISSSLLGHGFGGGTPSRPVHMEISYLEIFHKQGLIGMIFWGSLAGAILIQYRKAVASPAANAFFFSALFIFIESLTNQYINNPIGMSMLLLSLVCLYKLKRQE
jgi:hypothetical protein